MEGGGDIQQENMSWGENSKGSGEIRREKWCTRHNLLIRNITGENVGVKIS